MKKRRHEHAAKKPAEKVQELSGVVGWSVSDEDLYVSQRGNDRLFIALSAAISAVSGTYECFGVRLSVLLAHDDHHHGLKNFVQIHAVLPETGLLNRLDPESRFLLDDFLRVPTGEIDKKQDFGLSALCHHFHAQPLFAAMLERKAERQRNQDNKLLVAEPATA